MAEFYVNNQCSATRWTTLYFYGGYVLTGLGGSPGLACISGLKGGRCMAGIPGLGPHWPGGWPGGTCCCGPC